MKRPPLGPLSTRRVEAPAKPLSTIREFTVRVFWLLVMKSSFTPALRAPALIRPLSAAAPMEFALSPLFNKPPDTRRRPSPTLVKVVLKLPTMFRELML